MAAKITLVENAEILGYPSSDYDFSPNIFYPEYPWPKEYISKEENKVYDLVRECFRNSGLDNENYGTKDWNPLGSFIIPGQTVLIKPNWVENKNKNQKVNDNLACLVTNPSVVRAVMDYVYIALKGNGRIILADAPMQQCDIQDMFKIVGYDKLFAFYLDKLHQNLDVYDLRKYSITAISRGVYTAPKMTENSPGSIDVHLNEYSLHAENDKFNPQYKVSEYRKSDTAKYHHKTSHVYEVSQAAIIADVIVNIPKPKTHRLAGMTAAIKNMVGITYEKACLPHRKEGDIESGGDTYLKKSFWKNKMQYFDEKKTIASTSSKYKAAWIYDKLMKLCYCIGWLTTGDKYRIGSWYGNDTIWRTSIDLNYILLHANKNGIIQKNEQRKVVTIADMIISGQGSGPVGPHPKPLGMIMMSDNSLLFDRVMCEIMGFDKNKIKMFVNPLAYIRMGYNSEKELENELIRCNGTDVVIREFIPNSNWKFDAHPCWKGHIEK